ncbi:MAG TPA: D-lyxose/D-mannose family sugar isomerase, partial [Flexilinea sp.]|nr:D-lyxose/D-mannose family sugar isomerase [Flexilinea sp.]
MKRSEINQIIRNADAYLKKMNFYLPEWAYWDWETWKKKDRSSLHEILTKEMGWDITDFALDDFYHRGMLLFTIRNGSTPETGYDKPYCEKIMILEDGQKCLLHFHWDKVEDIINRGGGTLKLQFYNATADEQLDQKNPVILYVDGIR